MACLNPAYPKDIVAVSITAAFDATAVAAVAVIAVVAVVAVAAADYHIAAASADNVAIHCWTLSCCRCLY